MNIKGIGNVPVNDLKSQQPSTKAEKAPGGRETPPSSLPSSATVELSSKARGLKEIERSLADLPAVDEQRVRELKQRVDSGTYQVNSQSVAKNLLGIEEIL